MCFSMDQYILNVVFLCKCYVPGSTPICQPLLSLVSQCLNVPTLWIAANFLRQSLHKSWLTESVHKGLKISCWFDSDSPKPSHTLQERASKSMRVRWFGLGPSSLHKINYLPKNTSRSPDCGTPSDIVRSVRYKEKEIQASTKDPVIGPQL